MTLMDAYNNLEHRCYSSTSFSNGDNDDNQSQPMAASSGLLSCSRKHSISSNLGYGSRIMDNEKSKY